MAKDTSRGLALEGLTHIRERLSAKRTVSKRHRRVLHSWAFFQLRAFIAYKAALTGVRVWRW
jgi:IS605 OrfB family transposase